MKKDEQPVIVEETFKASINTVWDAITNISQMRQWYFENIPDFKPEVGFETSFEIRNEGRTFPHKWRVIKVINGQLIKYNWKYENYAGDSFVTFKLFENSDSTKLRLTTEIVEDFPDNIPEFRRESCVGGWEYFIKNRLKQFLEK